MRHGIVAFLFVLAACSSSNDSALDASTPADAAVHSDAQTSADAAEFPDATTADADTFADATTFADAGPNDSGLDPSPGFGAIFGPCRVLDDELTSPSSSFFANHIDFGTNGWDPTETAMLTAGGQEILRDGNAGGSSLESEIFAYEMLDRCEGATLLKTETEVVYTDPRSKLTDILVELDGMKIGVSVTRAVGFPRDDPYPVERAKMLLDDKLADILDSTSHVAPEDAWTKQILYIMAYAEQHAMAIETALGQVDPAIRADTIVMVTITDGDDAFIY
jgi:hypothetical protein